LVNWGNRGESTWFRRAEKGLEGDESCSDGKGGSPLVFQDIEADCSSLRADIWMPELGVEFHLERRSDLEKESYFGGFEGVLAWDLYVYFEDSSFVDCVWLWRK